MGHDGAMMLGQILRGGQLPKLDTLWLNGSREIGDVALDYLMSSLNVEGVKSLGLHDVNMGPAAREALTALLRDMRHLEYLDVSYNPFGGLVEDDLNMARILGSLTFDESHLKHLDLHANNLGMHCVDSLKSGLKSNIWPHLEYLSISHNPNMPGM